MKKENKVENQDFGLWLLGDSEPKNWKDKLDLPFDDRHPIVHNIWTSILDKVQDNLYREHKTRIDASRIYIRNAIQDAAYKPKDNCVSWDNSDLISQLEKYKKQINEHNPQIIISFGAFAFEFARRSLDEDVPHNYKYWGAERLGIEFRKRAVSQDNTVLLPLLHRSISSGHFLASHKVFCGNNNDKDNYFEFVSNKLFELLKDKEELMIK